MSAQDTYNDRPPVATAGMIAEHFSLRQIDSWLAGEEIPFGVACVLSATDDRQVVQAAAGTDKFVGISVFSQQLNVQDIATGAVSYKEKEQLPVMSKGRVWVKSAVAVNYGEDAYALPDGSGQFTNTGNTGANLTLYAKFRGSTTGADQLVIIELN